MSIVQVNEQTCTKCGVCVSTCQLGFIDMKEGEYPCQVSESERCATCGICAAICPNGSIEHQYMPLETLPSINPSLKVNFDQMSQLLKSRRSIRAYKNTPVPREVLTSLIDAVRYAPTAGNMQEVKWLVIDDAERLKRLREVGAKFWIESLKKVPNYDEVVDIFIKRKESGYDIIFHSAPAVVVTYAEENNTMASIDCTIALSYFDLAANSVGLGCCWLGFFSFDANNYPPIKEMIALPDGYQFYGCMTVGYPKYHFSRIPLRNSSDITWR